MKIKFSYLNVILTVIALAVVTLCLQNANIIRPIKVHEVLVKGGDIDATINGDVDVNISDCSTTIPVAIDDVVDVNIKNCNTILPVEKW